MLFLFGASGAIPVFGFGRWWTVLSAGWLHAGLLHIGDEHVLGLADGPGDDRALRAGADRDHLHRRRRRGISLSSFAGAYFPNLPFLHGAGLTVGASAPVFGLIGALYHYGRTGSSVVKQMAVSIMVQALDLRPARAGHRQLRAPRRVRRRLSDVGVPQPDDARARRPHDHRRRLPRRATLAISPSSPLRSLRFASSR